MRITLLAAAAAIAMSAQAASAQEITSEFRGFRAEGNVGWDHYAAIGHNNDKLGYGASAGFDGTLAEKIVIGAEGNLWRPGNHQEICTGGVSGGTVCSRSFKEYGVAVRGGYLVTPDLLVFGKGGYVINEQAKRFTAPAGEVGSFYDRYRTAGYQVGGGAEYTLTGMSLPLPVYVSAQYVYSQYNDHTHRQRVMGGVGVRFK